MGDFSLKIFRYGRFRSAWKYEYNTNRMCWLCFGSVGCLTRTSLLKTSTKKMGVGIFSFETSLNSYQTVRRYMPEDASVQVCPESYVSLTSTLFREIILARIYIYCMSLRNVLPGCTASQPGGKYGILVVSLVNSISRGRFDPNLHLHRLGDKCCFGEVTWISTFYSISFSLRK